MLKIMIKGLNKRFRKIALLITAFFFLLFNSFSFAAGTNFTASAPAVVSTGEQFHLVFELSGQGNNFKAPAIRDFNVLAGPSQSSSSSIQIINGNMTQSVTQTFTYVLEAVKEGTFIIGSASISLNGKEYRSNTLTIKVEKGSGNKAQSRSGRNQNSSGGFNGKINSDDIFIKTILSKNKVYQGEAVSATIKIYSRYSLVGFEDIKFPPFTGFWSEEIKIPQQVNLRNENINGTIYQVGELKKLILFPQKTGTLNIDPSEISCIIRVQARRSNNFFDQFFGGGYEDIRHKAKGSAVSITVLPYPQAIPIDFSGVSGVFNLKSSLDKSSSKTNEPISLKITISGKGNLKLIDKLKVNLPPDFDHYDPKITDNINITSDGMSGSRSFEYLLIPRNPGNYTIPAVNFVYFDLGKRSFITLSSPDYPLTIARGSSSGSSTISISNKEDINYIGSDIRYIKLDASGLKEKAVFFYRSLRFYLLFLLPFIILAGFIFIRRKHIADSKNVWQTKQRKANKLARKKLKKAAIHLNKKEEENFYAEISAALWGFIGDKLSIPPSNLSDDSITEALQQHQVNDALIERFRQTINLCEYSRFAPPSDDNSMENLYKNTVELISELEENIK